MHWLNFWKGFLVADVASMICSKLSKPVSLFFLQAWPFTELMLRLTFYDVS